MHPGRSRLVANELGFQVEDAAIELGVNGINREPALRRPQYHRHRAQSHPKDIERVDLNPDVSFERAHAIDRRHTVDCARPVARAGGYPRFVRLARPSEPSACGSHPSPGRATPEVDGGMARDVANNARPVDLQVRRLRARAPRARVDRCGGYRRRSGSTRFFPPRLNSNPSAAIDCRGAHREPHPEIPEILIAVGAHEGIELTLPGRAWASQPRAQRREVGIGSEFHLGGGQ